MTVEYQGWATIQESYREADDDEMRLKEIVGALQARLTGLSLGLGHFHFENFNGVWRLTVIGCRNHITGDWPEVLGLFRWIAEHAPGSYGMLSVINHEEEASLASAFDVHVLKKGRLVRTADVYLSPYHPVVEELP